MSETSHKYLRPEDVRRLANYRFAAKMMVEGWMSGRHRARGRGGLPATFWSTASMPRGTTSAWWTGAFMPVRTGII